MAEMCDPSVKRRFLRQNREIARVNSTQSLRIRTLEAETSRLLSENLVLREGVISLEHELENRPKREALEDLGFVKDKLEEKLAELGCLVFELGRAQTSAIATSAPLRRQSRVKSPENSPDQRVWKNALTLSEVTAGQDGRLPPILEDKYYPRKTLKYGLASANLQPWLMLDSTEELLGILNDQGDSANSPDLGPPPVAHFDDGDPVKHDGGHQTSLDSTSADLGSTLAFTNLETRRKRRESTFSKERTANHTSGLPAGLENTSTPIGTLSSQPLKLGAKRKLSARDGEERIDASTATVKDDFRFHRRPGASNEPMKNVRNNEGSGGGPETRRSSQLYLPDARDDTKDRPREVSLKSTTGRKALGEKSVNTDPVLSPRKPSKPKTEDKVGDIKKDLSRKSQAREHSRVKSSAPTPVCSILDVERVSTIVPMIEEISPPETDTVVLSTLASIVPPATPIYPDLNLCSPLSSQPTNSRPDTRDTPPPGDIQPDASSASLITATGRTTRRPRGSVSYAEPNLRDKMRRPGKELVDAVGADERLQRAAGVKVEDVPVGQSSVGAYGDVYISHVQQRAEPAKIHTVRIKTEEGTEDYEGYPARYRQKALESRAEPQSPLSAKTAAVEKLPSRVLMDRKKRVSEAQNSKDSEGNEIATVTKTVASTIPSSGSSSAIAALLAGTRTKQPNNLREDIGKRSKHLEEGAKTASAVVPDIYDFQSSSVTKVKYPSVQARSSSSSSITESKPADAGERVRVARRSSSVTDIDGAAPYVKATTGSVRGRRRRETLSVAADNETTTEKASVEGGGKCEPGSRAERAVARRRSMLV
ncbi:hypothetical protein MMC26_003188 [Xylographa opegraphella]|nr:hypothetical protein [Xylographa opegraphella]